MDPGRAGMRSVVWMFVVILGSAGSIGWANMRPTYLRCEYHPEPIIDEPRPRLSWLLEAEGRGQRQTAYQVLVASTAGALQRDTGNLWDSGKVNSDATCQIEYAGKPLKSRQRCYWKVRVWDAHGHEGPWSRFARWEMGLLDPNAWQAKWIGKDLTHLGQSHEVHLPPAPYLRKSIQIQGDIEKARLYITALGLYECIINGAKVSNNWLTPGWTDYHQRVPYQVYDVTDLIEEGENAIGVILSYGWYAGHVGDAQHRGQSQVKGFYGKVPALMARLEVEYETSPKDVLVTDGSWKAHPGPLLTSDLLHGETYDARKELGLWEDVDYDDTGWEPVEVIPLPKRRIECHTGNPVRNTTKDLLKAKKVIARPDGKYIFDMGQNIAGVVRLRVKGKAGDKVTLRYGEALHPDGHLMTENLRLARATDTYILKGDSHGETWTPRFTYHGFRFVEVSGYPGTPNRASIRGVVLGSAVTPVSSFFCSNDKLNQLYSNIVWTQRANLLEIPTNCPQRDERLGATGNAQISIGTAIQLMDVSAFYTKWLRDLNDTQRPDGTYPNVAPLPFAIPGMTFSPGWMEAGILCPYEIYRAYGDLRVIKTYWSNMERLMTFHEQRSKQRHVYREGSFQDIVPKGGFGDWLSIGKKTSPDLLATLTYGHCAQRMTEMASAIGKPDRAQHYRQITDKIKYAFDKHYVRRDGRFRCDARAYGKGEGYLDGKRGFTGHTQTAYANAITMNMLSPSLRDKAGMYLAGLVAANNGRLTTGVLGAKHLLPALSLTGHSDVAYHLLLQEAYPSWLFSVNNGATTIWERWNSYTKDRGIAEDMPSLNHNAFSTVYDWMFQRMGGIQTAEAGYRRIVFRPELHPKISHAKVTHRSIRGDISSHWAVNDKRLTYRVTVPPNITATVHVPTASRTDVTEGGHPVETVQDIQLTGYQDGYLRIDVSSGDYIFSAPVEP